MLIAANMRNSLYPRSVTRFGVTLASTKSGSIKVSGLVPNRKRSWGLLKSHWEALAVANPKCRVRVLKMSATYTHLSNSQWNNKQCQEKHKSYCIGPQPME